MYLNISDSATANNKGSSGGLVNYLEKENRFYEMEKPEYWFNHQHHQIEPYEVRHAIDNNIAKLCRTDSKFFLLNISPSQKEIRYLQHCFGIEGAKQKLKEYAEKVMDEYAMNFKRPGINSSEDLLWFAKLENYRYYSYVDKEVKNGLKKRGELKDGEQMHIQIIVGRKDITNTIKLSPMNNSRGRNKEHSVKLGQFNRVAFKQVGEILFDNMFDFNRQLKDSLAYANINVNGSTGSIQQMQMLEKGVQTGKVKSEDSLDIADRIHAEHFSAKATSIETIGSSLSRTLDALLERSDSDTHNAMEQKPHRKKRKHHKKDNDQSQGMSL